MGVAFPFTITLLIAPLFWVAYDFYALNEQAASKLLAGSFYSSVYACNH